MCSEAKMTHVACRIRELAHKRASVVARHTPRARKDFRGRASRSTIAPHGARGASRVEREELLLYWNSYLCSST